MALRFQKAKYPPETRSSNRAVMYMVVEFGRSGIRTYPMRRVPIKLPTVLTEVRRPTLPPTPEMDEVIIRMRKGPVMASKARGRKKRIAEARREPVTRLKSRHQ